MTRHADLWANVGACAAMLLGVVVLLLILATGGCASASAAIPRAIREGQAEQHYGLPRGLLRAVRHVETRSRDVVATGRGKDGQAAVCGAYQILVYALAAPDGEILCRSARGPAGVWMAAEMLALSRAWCATRSCPCPWARYNWGARRQWCALIEAELGR